MPNFQTIADRVEVEALRVEFTDAAMRRDGDRLASLFTSDGFCRSPTSRSRSTAGRRSASGRQPLVALWDFFLQTTHPGTIQIDGDTASSRAYIRGGSSCLQSTKQATKPPYDAF